MFGFLGVNGRQIYPFYSFTPTIQTWPPRCSRRLHSFRPARVKTGKGKGNGDHHIHIRSEIVAVPWQPQSWASETGRKGSGKAARISALPVTRLTRALHTRCALKIQQKALLLLLEKLEKCFARRWAKQQVSDFQSINNFPRRPIKWTRIKATTLVGHASDLAQPPQ